MLFFAKNKTPDLNIEMIIAGVKHYDSLVKSGEGEIIYTRYQAPFLKVPAQKRRCYLIFDGKKTRMEFEGNLDLSGIYFPKSIYLITPERDVWEIAHRKSRVSYAVLSKLPTLVERVDPRWMIMRAWRGLELSEYLAERGFSIKTEEPLGKIPCYLLEAQIKENQKERIWITPDYGFRFLKYEHRLLLRVGVPPLGIKPGTPGVIRRFVSYRQYGDAWFPQKELSQVSWIDSGGKEHLIANVQIEVKNFRLNHEIPEGKFIIEIPEDARIWVEDLHKFLSKEEFFKLHGLK